MNKLGIKEHTHKMKNIALLDAKLLLKSATLQHDRLVSFVPMLNLHHCVQLACNMKTDDDELMLNVLRCQLTY